MHYHCIIKKTRSFINVLSLHYQTASSLFNVLSNCSISGGMGLWNRFGSMFFNLSFKFSLKGSSWQLAKLPVELLGGPWGLCVCPGVWNRFGSMFFNLSFNFSLKWSSWQLAKLPVELLGAPGGSVCVPAGAPNRDTGRISVSRPGPPIPPTSDYPALRGKSERLTRAGRWIWSLMSINTKLYQCFIKLYQKTRSFINALSMLYQALSKNTKLYQCIIKLLNFGRDWGSRPGHRENFCVPILRAWTGTQGEIILDF
jgi:hypothetical protein